MQSLLPSFTPSSPVFFLPPLFPHLPPIIINSSIFHHIALSTFWHMKQRQWGRLYRSTFAKPRPFTSIYLILYASLYFVYLGLQIGKFHKNSSSTSPALTPIVPLLSLIANWALYHSELHIGVYVNGFLHHWSWISLTNVWMVQSLQSILMYQISSSCLLSRFI